MNRPLQTLVAIPVLSRPRRSVGRRPAHYYPICRQPLFHFLIPWILRIFFPFSYLGTCRDSKFSLSLYPWRPISSHLCTNNTLREKASPLFLLRLRFSVAREKTRACKPVSIIITRSIQFSILATNWSTKVLERYEPSLRFSRRTLSHILCTLFASAWPGT